MTEDGEEDERKAQETKSPPRTPKKKDVPEDASPREASGDEDEDEEDEEPRLKYASLTKSQRSLYRNGDAVSAFLVGGDKMVSVILELNAPATYSQSR